VIVIVKVRPTNSTGGHSNLDFSRPRRRHVAFRNSEIFGSVDDDRSHIKRPLTVVVHGRSAVVVVRKALNIVVNSSLS
jgi:hypothetical protein